MATEPVADTSRASRAGRLYSWPPLPWVVAAACFGAVMLWTALVTPRYRSEALLRVQEDADAGFGEGLGSLPGAAALGLSVGDEVETEMGVLRSRRVVDAAVDSLVLTVRLVRPRGERRAFVQVATRDGEDWEGTLRFVPLGDGRWRVAADLDGPGESPRARELGYGDTLRLGRAWIRLAPADSLAGQPFTLRMRRRADVREALQDRLDVRRPEIGSRLVALRVDDEDRVLAADVLRVMIGAYLAFRSHEDLGDLGSTAAELRRQVSRQGGALAGAEEALRRYQEASGLVVPEEQSIQQVKRYAALRAELDARETERAALVGVLEIVQQRAAGGVRATAYRQIATVPALFENEAVQNLVQTLVALETELSQLRLRRTDENVETRQLLARIAELDRSLLTTGTQYRESLDEGVRTLTTTLQGIDAELGALPARTMRYLRLAREAEVLSKGYLLLQQQLRQAELREALRLDQVRVVDAPEVAAADDPQFPRPLVHVVLALILSASAGLAVAAGRRASHAGAPVVSRAETGR